MVSCYCFFAHQLQSIITYHLRFVVKSIADIAIFLILSLHGIGMWIERWKVIFDWATLLVLYMIIVTLLHNTSKNVGCSLIHDNRKFFSLNK